MNEDQVRNIVREEMAAVLLPALQNAPTAPAPPLPEGFMATFVKFMDFHVTALSTPPKEGTP